MNHSSNDAKTLNRMTPLLRSIQVEISDRCRAIVALEQRLLAFLPTRRIHAEEVATSKAELAIQRRELHRIGKELSRLGIDFDAEHPRAILTPAPAQIEYPYSNEETGYRPSFSAPPG